MRWRVARRGGGHGGGSPTPPPPVPPSNVTPGFPVLCDVVASSGNDSSVQAAIATATDGQTLCIPAGTWTWTLPVSNCYSGGTPSFSAGCTAKALNIVGAGSYPTVGAATSGGTTIVDNVSNSTQVVSLMLREASSDNVTLSNITVNTSETFSKSFGFLGWEPGPVDPGVAGAKVIVMHHMTFNDGQSTTQLWRASTGRGVVYRNKFLRVVDSASGPPNGQAVFRCGMSGAFAASAWETPSTMGSADTNGDLAMYFEKNIATNYAQTSADAACRVVYRFNDTLENFTLSGHGKDSQVYSARQLEGYHNTFTCTGDGTNSFISGFVALRGAVQHIFGNTMDAITGTCTRGNPESAAVSVAVYMLRDKCGTSCFLQGGVAGSYPAPEQFGWGFSSGGTAVVRQGYTGFTPPNIDPLCPGGSIITDTNSHNGVSYLQDLMGSYYWDNYEPGGVTKIYDGTANTGGIFVGDFSGTDTCGFGLTSSTFIQENREWFKPATAGACDAGGGSCTSGIGRGTRAQRPTLCTTGVAWWATDQGGHWDTTSGNSNDGTLDKCTATNTWTNDYYTPKVYPHPLATIIGS